MEHVIVVPKLKVLLLNLMRFQVVLQIVKKKHLMQQIMLITVQLTKDGFMIQSVLSNVQKAIGNTKRETVIYVIKT